MKNIFILAVVLVSVLMSSCKSSEPEPSPNTGAGTGTNSNTVTGVISLHLHTYIGENEVELYNAVYRTDENRKLSLSFAQLYISNIKLVKFDGTLYPIKDTIVLSNIIDQVYKLGNVPVGNYKSIRFDVGLPSAINNSVPAGTGKLNDANMWFSETAQANNYIFMHAAGKIDTTIAGNSTDGEMVPFLYKIGTQSRLVQVSMPDQNVAVQPNGSSYIHMKADYAELFNGINLRDEANLSVSSIPDNSKSIAIDIASRIPKMFKYEN